MARPKRRKLWRGNHPCYGYTGLATYRARGACTCPDCEARRGKVDREAVARYVALRTIAEKA